ncbi:MAG: radical SAM family heme chaperone HemW [Culicoidibacterales bacterium]
MDQAQAVYLHIPFCDEICEYCDFAKVYYQSQQRDAYLAALEREVVLTLAKYPLVKPIQTLYLGGGTPTALNLAELEQLFTIINRYFRPFFAPHIELTIEANPDSLTEEKLAYLAQQGVNRLSIGVQTFQEKHLAKMGRTHTTAQVKDVIAKAKVAGFTNINVDFIYGIPGQTEAEVVADIEAFLQLDIQHISTYALIIEPHTKFYVQQKRGQLEETADEVEAQMYALIQAALREHGYEQYELSNFARPGFGSRHNLTYWQNLPYYGFGLGAHGYLANERYANTRAITAYLKKLAANELPITEAHVLTRQEQIEETVFLGLRTQAGVNKANFAKRFGETLNTIYGDVIAEHQRKGWIIETPTAICLAPDTLFIANQIMSDYLLDEA